jgi:hypothetical protein
MMRSPPMVHTRTRRTMIDNFSTSPHNFHYGFVPIGVKSVPFNLYDYKLVPKGAADPTLLIRVEVLSIAEMTSYGSIGLSNQ